MFAVLAALTFLALGGYQYLTLSALADNARSLREFAGQWALFAPIIFLVAQVAMLMTLVIPAWFCTVASGLIFGFAWGTAYALVGTTIGACSVFLATRSGLGGLAERAGPQVDRLAAEFKANALTYLIVLRLVPLFPFTLVNIAGAICGLKLRDFAIGTLVGVIPSVAIYANLGDVLIGLAQRNEIPDGNALLERRVLATLISLAALALLPLLVSRLRRRHDDDGPSDAA